MASSPSGSVPLPTMPPSLMTQQLKSIRAEPFFLIVGTLFVPLALTLVAVIFLCHSSLLVAMTDLAYAWGQYIMYLLWHRRGTRHSLLASNVVMLSYYIPLLIALISLRAIIHHSIARKFPHTSKKKRNAVLIFGLIYIALVGLGFRSIVSQANAMILEESSKGESGVTPSSLFLSLYHTTLLFSLLSLVSPFWVPTSDEQLRTAEDRLLKVHGRTSTSLVTRHYVAHHSYLVLEAAHDKKDIGSGQPDENEGKQKVSSSSKSSPSPSPSSSPSPSTNDSVVPIVFLHGYAAGKGFWFANLESISASLPGTRVYALDLLGMGCSAHQHTMDDCQTSSDAERYFVDGLERWRQAVGIEKMILVGHSFGGYISGVYALRYPDRVHHLLLVSPVGLPEAPPTLPGQSSIRGPPWIQRWPILKNILQWLWNRHITLSMGLHLLGPIGPFLFKKLVAKRFQHVNGSNGNGSGKSGAPALPTGQRLDIDALTTYCYHLNAGACPGHRGLNLLLKPGAFAFDPLLPRLGALKVGVSLLYGEQDWMDSVSGQTLTERLNSTGIYSECLIVDKSGHQLMIENPRAFNHAIVTIVTAAKDRQYEAKITPIPIRVEETTDSTESTELDEDDGVLVDSTLVHRSKNPNEQVD